MLVANQKQSFENKVKQYRPLGFKLLAGVVMLGFLGAASMEFFKAWILRDAGDQVHLWHIAELAALAILLLGGTLAALLRQPEAKPLLAQFAVVAFVIVAIGVMPFTIPAQVLPPMLAHVTIPGAIPAIAVLLLALLFTMLYPNTRAFFSISREGRVSITLLLLTIVMAAFMLPTARKEFNLQVLAIQYPDVHAQFFHWIGSALMIVLLIVAGLLTATKRPGWKTLGFITGEAYIYIGLIAMIVPDQTGSWGAAGGMFTIIAGIWYILITLLAAQATTKKTASQPAVETPSQVSEELVEAH